MRFIMVSEVLLISPRSSCSWLNSSSGVFAEPGPGLAQPVPPKTSVAAIATVTRPERELLPRPIHPSNKVVLLWFMTPPAGQLPLQVVLGCGRQQDPCHSLLSR